MFGQMKRGYSQIFSKYAKDEKFRPPNPKLRFFFYLFLLYPKCVHVDGFGGNQAVYCIYI